jgi:hypothetical protein
MIQTRRSADPDRAALLAKILELWLGPSMPSRRS